MSATGWIAGLLAATIVAAVLASAGVWDPEPAASVTFTLYGTTSGGWGETATTIRSPGPTLTVTQGDQVTMRLFSGDGPVSHTFLVDYNGNLNPDSGEPLSPIFSSRTTPLLYTFTADVAGRFTYWCTIHYGRMFGTFEVQASANTLPTVSAITTSPGPFTPEAEITFAATAADSDGDVLTYTWNFGDGTTGTGQTPAGGGAITATHTYPIEDDYTVTLSVDDGRGGRASSSLTITVVPQIFVAVLGPWTLLAVGQTMDLVARAHAAGVAVSGATMVVSVTPGLSLQSASQSTDANGEGRFQVRGLAAGPQSATVTISKTGLATGSEAYRIDVIDPPLTMALSLTSDTTEMMGYETATIDVHLTDITTTAGVTAGLFTIVSPAGGNISAVTELGGGDYRFRWDAPLVTVQTFAQLTVRAKVGGYTDATSRLTILVDPNKTGTQAQLFLIPAPEKSVLTSGETITVTVFVFTIEGYVVRGSSVVVRMLVQIGTLGPVVDRLNGVYTFIYTAPVVASSTSVSIRIDASKLTYGAGTARLTLQIVP